MTWLLYPWQTDFAPTKKEAGRALETFWMVLEKKKISSSARIQTLDQPVCS